eukprot:scaffold655_cov69-Phaeocystis_antarctica.AAC.4
MCTVARLPPAADLQLKPAATHREKDPWHSLGAWTYAARLACAAYNVVIMAPAMCAEAPMKHHAARERTRTHGPRSQHRTWKTRNSHSGTG